VPNDRARLRFFVASTHTDAEIDATVQLVVDAMRQLDRAETDRADDERDPSAAQTSGAGR
jgi:hypothetical protein